MAGLAAFGALAPPTAGEGQWSPGPCRSNGPDPADIASPPGSTVLAAVADQPWYRLDPVLDTTGTLSGQRLTVGINGARLDRSLVLPPESFAAGPFGRAVLVGTDDGRISRLMTIDVARRCASAIAQTDDVVRSATIAPDGAFIVEHRVDRATRADLGVWRRPVGGGPAVRWLAPIGPDARFGRTWSTLLGWTIEGTDLVVQSCAEYACRVRMADREAGEVRTLADPGLGLVVGVADDHVIAHGACRGLPCPLLSVDLATGAAAVIEPDGGTAMIVRSDRGPQVVVESLAADEPTLRVTAIDGSAGRAIGRLTAGLRLDGDDGVDGDGLRLPDGWVLVAPQGDLAGTDDRASTSVRSVIDGRTIPMNEVIR